MPKKIINVAKMWLQNGYLPQLTREDIGWLQFFLEITWSTHGGNNYGKDRSQEFWCGLFYRIKIVKKKSYYLLRLIPYPISKKSTLSMYKSLSRKKYSQASYYSKFFLVIQLAGPGLSKDASDSFFESLVKVLLQEIPQYKHIFL